MNHHHDLASASQTVSDFYKAHFDAYQAATPDVEDDALCECVSMDPKAVVLRFLAALRTTTDNHHPDGELCQHPFGTAVTQVSTAVINALENLEYPHTYENTPEDPTAQSNGIREFTRQAFLSACAETLLSSYTHCHQCAQLSTEHLFQQVKHGFGKSVDYPHGDDTVCDHPTHHANRRLIFTIYLGMDDAWEQMPKSTLANHRG